MGLFERRYITRAEERRVVEAITAAERGHRGEVHVHLEGRYPGDGPLGRAAELFDELGLAATADDTGVLLYVAVDDHLAAVYAGSGVYGAAEPGFWHEVISAVTSGFARGDRAGGLVAALERVGALLREAAPGEDTAGNELPDAVTVG